MNLIHHFAAPLWYLSRQRGTICSWTVLASSNTNICFPEHISDIELTSLETHMLSFDFVHITPLMKNERRKSISKETYGSTQRQSINDSEVAARKKYITEFFLLPRLRNWGPPYLIRGLIQINPIQYFTIANLIFCSRFPCRNNIPLKLPFTKSYTFYPPRVSESIRLYALYVK